MLLLIVTIDPIRPGASLAAAANTLGRADHDLFLAAPACSSLDGAFPPLGTAGWLPLRRAGNPLALAINVWAVGRWARVLRPDLLLADSAGAGVIANMARGAAGNGALSVLMLNRLPPTTGFLNRMLATKAIQECDRLLVPETWFREACVTLGARRADTLIAAGPAQVAGLCEDLEREYALVRPRPVSRGS